MFCKKKKSFIFKNCALCASTLTHKEEDCVAENLLLNIPVDYTNGYKGGGTPAAPPPSGRGPMTCYAPNAEFPLFFRSPRSQFSLQQYVIELGTKHAEKYFKFNRQHFQ